MLQFIIVPLALLVSGCQMLTQRTPASEPTRTVIIEEGKGGAVVSYVALPAAPGASSTSGLAPEALDISPKALARVMARPDPQLEADIRAFSRMSEKTGGPSYALLPPSMCAQEAKPKRGSNSKKPVCYTTEDEGSVVIHMTRP